MTEVATAVIGFLRLVVSPFVDLFERWMVRRAGQQQQASEERKHVFVTLLDVSEAVSDWATEARLNHDQVDMAIVEDRCKRAAARVNIVRVELLLLPDGPEILDLMRDDVIEQYRFMCAEIHNFTLAGPLSVSYDVSREMAERHYQNCSAAAKRLRKLASGPLKA
jgi:hypothetical protein